MTEQAGNLGGVTYDKTVYTITVEVTDNGVGNLVADLDYAVAGAEKDGITFTNVYKAAPVEVVIDGNKELTGRKLAEDEFTFELKEKGETIDSVSNDAEGRFVFEALTFDEVGEYEYEVSELKGTLGGVTYDETVYTVAVKVTDNGEGNLEAAVSYKQNEEDVNAITFTNVYDAAPASLVIEAEKVLKGRELKADEFTFVLETEAGEKLYATNTADGKIVFEELVYDEAGLYTYKLYEESGDLANVTYDKAVYTITVMVTDDLEGKLVAKADSSGEKLVFENTYVAPAIKTGDNARIALWFALAGMAMVTVLVVVKRRFS